MSLRLNRVRPMSAMTLKEQKIRTLALFRECSTEDVRLVARLGDEIEVGAARVLAHEGSSSRDFVVVLDGVAVGSCASGETVLLPGSCYGGFYDRPHALDVRTLTAVRLMVFPQRSLRALMTCVPSIASAATVWTPPRVAERTRTCRCRDVRTAAMHPAV